MGTIASPPRWTPRMLRDARGNRSLLSISVASARDGLPPLDPSYIAKVETGKLTPSLAMLYRLAREVGLDDLADALAGFVEELAS